MNIFEEAENLVNGQRREDYGDASENLQRIADAWTALLPTSRPLTINDVCIAMTSLKLARMVTVGPKRDSVVDGCGYLRLMELTDEGLRQPEPEPAVPTHPTICEGCGHELVWRRATAEDVVNLEAEDVRDDVHSDLVRGGRWGWAEADGDPHYGLPFYCAAATAVLHAPRPETL